MRQARDISGMRFGRLTALYRLDKKSGTSYLWRCRCDCGREKDVRLGSLLRGCTTSCGCLREEHKPPALQYVDGTCIERIENPARYANNTSGYTGVVPLKDGRWRAEITFQGKRRYLGVYRDIQLAAEARRKAEERIFGEFLDDYYAAGKESAAESPAESAAM